MTSYETSDDELKKIEKYLTQQFRIADKEIQRKSKAYFRKFAAMTKRKEALVKSGKMTQQEFNQWKTNKILYGEHWTRLSRDIQDTLANVNSLAVDYVNGKVPEIFATSYNDFAEKINNNGFPGISGVSFEVVNKDTVRNLVYQNGIILPPPKQLDKYKDKQWNAKKINSVVLQGILQGSPMDEIANSLSTVTQQNYKASIRNARTMVTAAENSGRISGFNRAEQMGIVFEKVWIATHDGRVRDTHAALDHVTCKNGELFANGCEFPGDWRGPASEVYNCRCTIASNIIGFNKMEYQTTVTPSDQPDNSQTQTKAKSKSKTKEKSKNKIAGVEAGEPMTFEEADTLHTNPNYGDIGYDINCQSVVPTFEARMRGYNVIAKSNYRNAAAKALSRNTNLIWIDPETGTHPEYIQDPRLRSAEQYLPFVKDTIKQGERYSIEFGWAGRGNSGHIVNIDRNEDGKLRIHDNQRGKGEKAEWLGDDEVLEYLKKMKYETVYRGKTYSVVPKLLRLDNMEFDYKMASKIMEKAP